jgi:hypothetical protein
MVPGPEGVASSRTLVSLLECTWFLSPAQEEEKERREGKERKKDSES